MNSPVHVLFVCFGNICRSPMAQAVLQRLVDDANLSEAIQIHSAGFSPHLAGRPYHPLTQEVCEQFSLPLEGASTPVQYSDLATHHYVLAMDRANLADLKSLDQGSKYKHKLYLLRDFGSERLREEAPDIPDPVAGHLPDFLWVHELIWDSCKGLLAEIRAEHKL